MLAGSRETNRKEAAWEIYALSRTPQLGCYVPLMSKTRRRPTEIREWRRLQQWEDQLLMRR
jgi:hypothetical protein